MNLSNTLDSTVWSGITYSSTTGKYRPTTPTMIIQDIEETANNLGSQSGVPAMPIPPIPGRYWATNPKTKQLITNLSLDIEASLCPQSVSYIQPLSKNLSWTMEGSKTTKIDPHHSCLRLHYFTSYTWIKGWLVVGYPTELHNLVTWRSSRCLLLSILLLYPHDFFRDHTSLYRLTQPVLLTISNNNHQPDFSTIISYCWSPSTPNVIAPCWLVWPPLGHAVLPAWCYTLPHYTLSTYGRFCIARCSSAK